MPREFQVHIHDLLVSVLTALLRLERSVSGAQLVAEHSYAPDVHQVVVVVPDDYLGGDVVECPTEGDSLPT